MFKYINEYLTNTYTSLKTYITDESRYSGINYDKTALNKEIITDIRELLKPHEFVAEWNDQIYYALYFDKNWNPQDPYIILEKFYFDGINMIFGIVDLICKNLTTIIFANSQIMLINIDVYNYIIIFLLILYVIQINNINNKYTVYKIFFVILILMYFILYKSNNIYLVCFIILTELFSVYLILLITAKINKIVFKYNNNFILLYLLILLYNLNNIFVYTYFDYYSSNGIMHTNYMYFLIIFKTYHIYTLLVLLLLVTVLILNLFLSKVINEKQINVSAIWSNFYLLVNKIQNNLNLYIDSFIFKWK